jgi:hypothetical protein
VQSRLLEGKDFEQGALASEYRHIHPGEHRLSGELDLAKAADNSSYAASQPGAWLQRNPSLGKPGQRSREQHAIHWAKPVRGHYKASNQLCRFKRACYNNRHKAEGSLALLGQELASLQGIIDFGERGAGAGRYLSCPVSLGKAHNR